MIDVVFLLLIFFMVTAKFVSPERKIPAFGSEQEESTAIALVPEYKLSVVEGVDGEVVVVGEGGVSARVDALEPIRNELREYRDRNLVEGELAEDAGVYIQCEDHIGWRAVVRVLDVIREVKIPNIRFQ